MKGTMMQLYFNLKAKIIKLKRTMYIYMFICMSAWKCHIEVCCFIYHLENVL